MKQLLAIALGMLLGTTALAQVPYPFTTTEVTDLNEPWAMEFLPDGRILVTEKAGTIQLVTQFGQKTEVAGAPEVDYFFQGGLGDIVLHPDFESNNTIYLSYVEAGANETRGAVVARGTLDLAGPSIEGLEVIWKAEKVEGGLHYSHRIAFDDEGFMFVSAGDRNEQDPAQDPTNTLGSILRLNDDGTPAAGNPLASMGMGGDSAEIFSYGHRNPLGIDFDSEGRLWNIEMGPRGGDELNLVAAGDNFGYPVVSNGNNYDGVVIPNHDTRGNEFVHPKVWWNPVISPSSLMFYDGDAFPQWKGNGFISGLSSMAIVRIAVNGDNAIEAERFMMGARMRSVEQGPNGNIWALVDGAEGKLVVLTPR